MHWAALGEQQTDISSFRHLHKMNARVLAPMIIINYLHANVFVFNRNHLAPLGTFQHSSYG